MTNGKLTVDHITDLEIGRGERWDRREFMRGLGALAGSAGLLGYDLRPAAAEPSPETTRLRLMRKPSICEAAEYVAEDLLKGEGFTEVRYVEAESFVDSQQALVSGKADLTTAYRRSSKASDRRRPAGRTYWPRFPKPTPLTPSELTIGSEASPRECD
jgi:hypothetical protein